jgi:parvulin-like peptidyl-prolyl isomerase
MLRILVLAVALTVFAAAPAAAQDPFTVTTPDGMVYGATAEDLGHWTDVARRSESGRQSAALAFQLLVGHAWILGEAAERGIEVTHEEAVAEFRRQRDSSFSNRRQYRRFLRESGQNVDDLLFRVRHDMLSTAIREQVVAPAEASVTEAVVDAYLARHGIPRTPERRDLRIVLTTERSTALAAKRELLAGATWHSVTRRYSIDKATIQHDGRLPDQARGTLERRLDRAVFRARVGTIVGPVRTRSGYYVVRVSRIHPSREIPMADARELARYHLVSRAQEAALDAFIEEFHPKWRARTVCAPRWRSQRECGSVG